MAQVIEKRILKIEENSTCKVVNVECFSYKLLKTCVTFIIVTFAWIFFRADSLQIAFAYIHRMFSTFFSISFDFNTLFTLGLNQVEWRVLIIAIVTLFCVDKVQYKYGMRIDTYLETQNRWFKWSVCIFLFCFMLVYGVYGPGSADAAFIYFQF